MKTLFALLLLHSIAGAQDYHPLRRITFWFPPQHGIPGDTVVIRVDDELPAHEQIPPVFDLEGFQRDLDSTLARGRRTFDDSVYHITSPGHREVLTLDSLLIWWEEYELWVDSLGFSEPIWDGKYGDAGKRRMEKIHKRNIAKAKLDRFMAHLREVLKEGEK